MCRDWEHQQNAYNMYTGPSNKADLQDKIAGPGLTNFGSCVYVCAFALVVSLHIVHHWTRSFPFGVMVTQHSVIHDCNREMGEMTWDLEESNNPLYNCSNGCQTDQNPDTMGMMVAVRFLVKEGIQSLVYHIEIHLYCQWLCRVAGYR